MKFKYVKKFSKMYDYFLFPRVYYSYNEQDEDQIFEEILDKEILNFYSNMEHELAKYETEINKYYQKGTYAEYEFINILLKAFPINDYKDEHHYLNYLKDIDDDVFKKGIIKAMFTIQDEDFDQEVNESDAFNYINTLKLESANKWNLFLMIQNPKEHLKGFTQLLTKIEHYYYAFYEKYDTKAEEVADKLIKRLSSQPNKEFSKITKNAIEFDFSGYDECQVYISILFPFTMRFFNTDECRFVWGIEMEQAFNKVEEINENKLIQRVKIFKALGDQTRYETLRLLASGVTAVKDIASTLDVSSATISYHINEFLTSGVIIFSREKNKKVGYLIDYQRLEEVIDNLKKDLNFPEK